MKTVDGYIAGFPPDVQEILQKIRMTIRKAAPDAEETISYQIPAFKQNGALVYFAAYQSHVGMYPITRTVSEKFRKELSPYAAGKSTAKFPLDRPIPYTLISKIVKFRVDEKMRGRPKQAAPRKAAG
jgi:uncharacterized protein YdhG (YjbR/CyaY superfamily)